MGQGRFLARVGSVVVAATALLGCGEANDQGISFRLLGWFLEDLETFEDGRDKCLECGKDIACDPFVPDNRDDDPEIDNGFLCVENNMLQGIRVERIDFTYSLTGSNIDIPPNSVGTGLRLGPSNQQEFNPSRGCAQVFVIGPEMFEFLNQNRPSLPDPPYRLIATARAVGVADNGNVLVTPPANYTISFQECTILGEDEVEGDGDEGDGDEGDGEGGDGDGDGEGGDGEGS